MSTYSNLILGDSPSLYWRLSDAPSDISGDLGYLIEDISGNGYDGEAGPDLGGSDDLSNHYTLQEAGALARDSDSCVRQKLPTVPDEPHSRIDAQFGPINYYTPWSNTVVCTVEGWFKCDGFTYGNSPQYGDHSEYALFGDAGAACPFLSRSLTDDTLTFGIYQFPASNRTWTNTGFSLNTWHYVAVRYNPSNSASGELAANTVEVFLDGQSLGTASVTQNGVGMYLFQTGEHTGSFTVGYSGWIDEIATYESVLSAAQILEHYNTGSGVLPDVSPLLPSYVHTAGRGQ